MPIKYRKMPEKTQEEKPFRLHRMQCGNSMYKAGKLVILLYSQKFTHNILLLTA
jgi:hypothetical protein